MQALATLTNNLTTLTDNVNCFIQNPPPVNISALVLCPKSYVQCPATYNGKTPADARRFLAAYKAWTADQGTGMQVNRATAAALAWVANDKLWIITACSFLEGDAADWATSIVEGMETLTPPFTDYPAFVTAFHTHFEMIDEAGDILTVLEQLWQGTKTVQNYTALFKQHVGRTRLSDDDKLIRYQEYLSTFIKDRLAETDCVYNTFDTIVTIATDIDKRHRERMAEKAQEAGRSASSTSSKLSGTHQASPFQQATDPDAMDISADTSGSGNGKTQECYGDNGSIRTHK